MTDTSPETVAEIVRQLRVPGVGALWGNGDLFPDAADMLESLSAALAAERTAREAAEAELKISREDFATMMAKRLCVEKVEGERDRAIRRAEAAERHLTEARRVVVRAWVVSACHGTSEADAAVSDLRDALGDFSALDRGPDGDTA